MSIIKEKVKKNYAFILYFYASSIMNQLKYNISQISQIYIHSIGIHQATHVNCVNENEKKLYKDLKHILSEYI